MNVGTVARLPFDPYANPDLRWQIRVPGSPVFNGIPFVTKAGAAMFLRRLFRCTVCDSIHSFGSPAARKCATAPREGM